MNFKNRKRENMPLVSVSAVALQDVEDFLTNILILGIRKVCGQNRIYVQTIFFFMEIFQKFP